MLSLPKKPRHHPTTQKMGHKRLLCTAQMCRLHLRNPEPRGVSWRGPQKKNVSTFFSFTRPTLPNDDTHRLPVAATSPGGPASPLTRAPPAHLLPPQRPPSFAPSGPTAAPPGCQRQRWRQHKPGSWSHGLPPARGHGSALDRLDMVFRGWADASGVQASRGQAVLAKGSSSAACRRGGVNGRELVAWHVADGALWLGISQVAMDNRWQ